jgi:hypothetical protein
VTTAYYTHRELAQLACINGEYFVLAMAPRVDLKQTLDEAVKLNLGTIHVHYDGKKGEALVEGGHTVRVGDVLQLSQDSRGRVSAWVRQPKELWWSQRYAEASEEAWREAVRHVFGADGYAKVSVEAARRRGRYIGTLDGEEYEYLTKARAAEL